MKDIKEILEDAQDGRLKKKNQKKAKDIIESIDKKTGPCCYEWQGKTYTSLRDIPVPLTQAHSWLALGKIKEIK